MSFIDWELENYPQNFGKLRCSEVIDRQTLTHVICNMDSPEGVERDVFARVMSEVAKTLDKVPFCEIEQNAPGWISVKDRLPKETQDCASGVKIKSHSELCIVAIETEESAFYVQTDITVCGKWYNYGNRITHWMPLPEPPKEEAK